MREITMTTDAHLRKFGLGDWTGRDPGHFILTHQDGTLSFDLGPHSIYLNDLASTESCIVYLGALQYELMGALRNAEAAKGGS